MSLSSIDFFLILHCLAASLLLNLRSSLPDILEDLESLLASCFRNYEAMKNTTNNE